MTTTCICADLDWSEVDRTAEHHPECAEYAKLCGVAPGPATVRDGATLASLREKLNQRQPTGTRYVTAIFLKGDRLVIKRDRILLDRPDTAAVITDPIGTGHMWIANYNCDPMFVAEGPDGRTTLVDLRIMLQRVGMLLSEIHERAGEATAQVNNDREVT